MILLPIITRPDDTLISPLGYNCALTMQSAYNFTCVQLLDITNNLELSL